jgi:uncharacterized protein YqeY
MSLKEQLKTELKDAMKAKDINARDNIRAINTAIKQIEVDERRDVGDEEILKIIQKLVKQREDSITAFAEAGRDDLVAKEQAEADFMKKYLPQQLSDDELESQMKSIIEEVGATSMKDMGKIMGVATKKLANTADGKRINEMVKKLLG